VRPPASAASSPPCTSTNTSGRTYTRSLTAGIERFFARVWRVVTEPDGDTPAPGVIDRAVAAVGEATERLTFNVALARLMELAPQARSAEAKRVLVRLLAPFAPHLAEELWDQLGEAYSVHAQAWPSYNSVALRRDHVNLVVQVNGKVRAHVEVPTGLNEAQAVAAAATVAAASLAGKEIVRAIHVPDRLVNLVTSQTAE
jgi:leucyl-tRNA synthetase